MSLITRFNKLDPLSKTSLQILYALVIVLFLTLVLSWSFGIEPQIFILTVGTVFEAEGGTPIAGFSLWFFALSISWFLYRDNQYLNSFLIHSIIPLGILTTFEFVYYYLFWDYIHLLPLIIGIYIICKKRDSLKQKWMLISTAIVSSWILAAYFLNLAYSNIPMLMFLLGLVIYAPVMVGISFFLKKTKKAKMGAIKKIIKGFLVGLWIFGLFLGSVLIYWYLRPSNIVVNDKIVLESWPAVQGLHNSNTEMISWNGTFYLVHDQRIYHMGHPDAKLIIWKSDDARSWTKVQEFTIGEDLRDPKFAIINNSLFLYALKNRGFFAIPYQTVYTYSDNGSIWQPLEDISNAGWLFWRPKTFDNISWYVSAYWFEHGRAALFNSTDGINWNMTAIIHEGDAIDETAIDFLNNGTMICVGRLEGSADNMFGSPDASTLIATSPYPYENWTSFTKSSITRLDGPILFSYDNKTFAIGRRQIGPVTIFTELGGVFSRKRTAIYHVETSSLTHLTDLPSQGDTAYAGIVINGSDLYVSYYTSDLRFDYPWILGMMAESDVRIARINLTALSAWADTH